MDTNKVTVVDFDVSFGSLVWLMIKVAIAAIPAAIVLALFGGGVAVIFGIIMAAAGKGV